MPTCDECDREFDTERGLKVHQSQMHSDDEDSTQTAEETDTGDEETTETETGFGPITLRLRVTHAIILAFAVGVLVGGFGMATLYGVNGATGALAAPSQDAGSNDGGGDAPTQPTQEKQDSIDPSKISLEGEPVKGSADAPVTMVMYEDYECPFCKRFEEQTLPQIVSNYVDSGKVKLVWKDLPLPERIHPWADEGAEAMECVYRVGGDEAFWPVKNKVFANQDSITKSNVYDKVKQWAVDQGVSGSQLQQCYDNGAMQEINEDKQEARSVGASGTPTIFINGKKIVGAQPYSAFKQVIDSELN